MKLIIKIYIKQQGLHVRYRKEIGALRTYNYLSCNECLNGINFYNAVVRKWGEI